MNAERERVRAAAVAAAVGIAHDHGVAVEDPVVLHDLFSVRVHLRPAPVVARIPTWVTRLRSGTDALAREIDVATYLAGAGAPVVAPSAELPPGPHHRDGYDVTFWTYARPDPDRTATAEDCAAMLPDLHAALRGYPDELPALANGPAEVHRWLATLDTRDHGLGADDIAALHRAAHHLAPLLDAPGQPLHGDAHAGNLLATRGRLLWIDLEEVCRGPLEWDLATIGEPVAFPDADPDRLAACGQLRTLQVVLCLAHLRDAFADLPGWDDAIRSMLPTVS